MSIRPLRLLVGHDLDGGAWPDGLAGARASCGEATVGPAGLLEMLELRLGLGGPTLQPPIRIARYLARLRAADAPGRFFSASLAIDPWSTARRLLAWRDELVEAGWDRSAIAGPTGRVADLAAVEAQSALPDVAGRSERFRAVVEALPNDPHDLAIASITLVEPRELWAPAWRRLFAILEERGINISDTPSLAPPACVHDLTTLQRALSGRETGARAMGDGSLMLLRADTESDAAEAVACWLAADPAANAGVVVVRGDGSELLDEALRRHGLPRLGVDVASRWRAVLQVLPLALANSWKPFSAYRLLELLTLPRTPVPYYAARELVEALREHPGIGGARWHAALAAARASYETFLAKRETKESAAATKLAEYDEDVARWLERERFDPVEGMPAAELLRICDDVARWGTRQAAGADDDLFRAIASHASLLAESVRASGLERLPRTQLDRMLDTVVGAGVASAERCAEASPWAQVCRPGQLHGEAETVIWWGFLDDGSGARRAWLPAAELAELAAAGVELEDAVTRRLRIARAWHAPIVHATGRVVLVAPRLVAGAAATTHPMWDEIRAAIAPDDASEGRLVVDATTLLRSAGSCELAGRALTRRSVRAGAPPGPRREWRVRPGTIERREVESPSSIESLVGCPLAWTFKYPAGIRGGSLVALPEGNQMLGTLAHAIVQRMFDETKRWDPPAAGARAVELFDELAPAMAASLLEPGSEVEHADARATVRRSIPILVRNINDAGLEVVATEQESRATLPGGGEVRGVVDLLLRDAKGTPVILDLKWAKRDRYHRQKLVDGTSVQLAGYARMHAPPGVDGGDGYPDAAYFMFRQGTLFAASDRTFPNEYAAGAPGLDEVWREISSGHRVSFEMLASGRIVAPWIPEDPPDDGEIVAAAGGTPDAALAPCRFCEFTTLCCREREATR